MAHFAQIKNKKVTQVVVINNEAMLDKDGIQQESIGLELCRSLFGQETQWVQTSYNGNFRYNYASFGYTWDGTGFAAAQPFASWALDAETYQWAAPTPMPTDGERYQWDEPTLSWVAITL